MKNRTTHRASLLCMALSVALSIPVAAQIPDTFDNLQFLPKEIAQPELIGAMRGISMALGVRCNHCHVGPDNLQGMDFATDEKAAKRTARGMMKMVAAINDTYLPAVRETPFTEVTCSTCHRGVSNPIAAEDWLAARIEEKGVEAGLADYRDLRTQYHGTAAYDFSMGPLNALAQRLAAAGEFETAIAIMEFNLEFHDEDPVVHAMIGGIQHAAGNTAQAVAAFRKALELDPGNPWFVRQLAALEPPKPEAASQPEPKPES